MLPAIKSSQKEPRRDENERTTEKRTWRQRTDRSNNEKNGKTVIALVPSAVPRGPCDQPRSIKGFCSWGHKSPYLNYLKKWKVCNKEKRFIQKCMWRQLYEMNRPVTVTQTINCTRNNWDKQHYCYFKTILCHEYNDNVTA